MLEFETDASPGDGRILGAQVVGYLVDDMLVAARFELGIDHMLDIRLGSIAEEP